MTDKKLKGLGRIDERIERLIQRKEEYIKQWAERRKRHTPKLQKRITDGMGYIALRLERIKKWEEKIAVFEERIKVLELQIQDKRKVVQRAQEKLREYETTEPGVGEFIKKERENSEWVTL